MNRKNNHLRILKRKQWVYWEGVKQAHTRGEFPTSPPPLYLLVLTRGSPSYRTGGQQKPVLPARGSGKQASASWRTQENSGFSFSLSPSQPCSKGSCAAQHHVVALTQLKFQEKHNFQARRTKGIPCRLKSIGAIPFVFLSFFLSATLPQQGPGKGTPGNQKGRGTNFLERKEIPNSGCEPAHVWGTPGLCMCRQTRNCTAKALALK